MDENTIVNQDEEHQEEIDVNGVEEQEDSFDILESVLETENPTDSEQEEVEEVIENEEQPEKKVEPKDLIVDDSLIEKYPSLSTLKGQSIEEVAKTYDAMEKEYTRLKTKTENYNPTEEKNNLDDLPDPLDEPDEFKKALEKLVEDKANKILELKQQEQTELTQAQENAQKERESFINGIEAELSKQLPNVKPEEAMQFYFKENSHLLGKDGKIDAKTERLFIENPNFLVKTVVDFIELANTKQNFDKNVKKNAYEIAKNGFNKKAHGELSYERAERVPQGKTEDDNLVNALYDLSVETED